MPMKTNGIMLDHAALSALAAVVREGSVERAVQALFATPSAVSQRTRSLEERVGCALVERGQPCRPTDTGRRLCHRDVELARHAVPSAHAVVTAALAGMGWGLHPHELIAPLPAKGSRVERVPGTALDVPRHWQHARAASSLIDGLSREVVAAAARTLRPP